jgi:hypothetical protein
MVDDRWNCHPERSSLKGCAVEGPLTGVTVRLLPPVALTLALLACSSTAEPAIPIASIRDSAGVAIVTSTTGAWQDGEAWEVDSVPTTVLGADENDPQQQWRSIEAAVRFADGRIAVAVDGSIRLFGADGRFVRLLSRTGEGPGEFRRVGALQLVAGDTLRVHDPWLTRVADYAPDGRYSREQPLALDRFNALGRWVECVPMLLVDGSQLACQEDSTAAGASGTESSHDDAPGTHRRRIRRWAVPPTLDTAYPLGMFSGLTSHNIAVAPGRTVSVLHPFDPWPQIAGGGSPLRIALWASHDYRIELWTPAGVLERIVQRIGARRATPKVATPEEREYTARTIFNLDAATRERVLDAVPRPDSMPALVDLEFTSDGHLLVQREGFLAMQSTSSWDVFAPDGRFLGSFRLPGNARIIQAGKDFLLVQRRTVEGGVLVEIYRVTR